jgi:excisionase family DNA binding protein
MKRAKKAPPKPAKKTKSAKQITAPANGALVVTIDQAALLLAIGRVSVYKLLRAGKLDGPLLGRARRISRASIDRLVGASASNS